MISKKNVSPGDLSVTLPLIRTFLLLIFLVGAVGSGAELLLLEHTEDIWQYAPLVLLALSVVVLIWSAIGNSRRVMQVFQAVTVFFVIAGVGGVFLHYKGNVEFELEMYPNLAGFDLFWKAMTGATPALAPGTMTLLGLIGWIYTFRHPTLEQNAQTPEKPIHPEEFSSP